MTTAFDGAGRPTGVSGSLSGTGTSYVTPLAGSQEYLPHGAPNVYVYGNNVVPVNTFNSVLEPLETYATWQNSANYWMLYIVNHWNGNGTLGSLTELLGPKVTWGNMSQFNAGFGYDGLNRLMGATDSGWTRNFGYDPFGNMAVTSYSGATLSALTPQASQNSYNLANNRLIEAVYDSNGQVKTLGAVGFTYDAGGEIAKITDTINGVPVTVNYTYDGEGNRALKTVTVSSTTTTTAFVQDAFGSLAAEYSSVAITPACTTCYLNYDYLGSVRMVTDQNSNIVARHDYLPYGETLDGCCGRTGNGFGMGANVNQMFTGQERDPEAVPNVDFFNARYFSAVAGSFLRPDPGNAGADIGNLQSWRYGYVSGNPLNGVDPSGMTDCDPGYPCFFDNGAWLRVVRILVLGRRRRRRHGKLVGQQFGRPGLLWVPYGERKRRWRRRGVRHRV